MALTALSTYQLTPDVTFQPVVVDELLPLVRWQAVAGDGLQIAEVTDGNTGSVGWMAADAVAPNDAADPSARTIPICRVGGEFDLGQGYQQVYSAMIDQEQAQRAVKRTLLRQAIGHALVLGSGASDEPTGLVTQATQSISGGSVTLTLTMLRSLLYAIQTQGGHCDYLVMSGAMLVTYRGLYDTALQPAPTVVDARTGRTHTAYCGVPILRNDHLPDVVAADSTILALNLDAVRLIYPAGVGDRGLVETKLATRSNGSVTVRLTQAVGVALMQTSGLAVLTAVRP